MPFKQIQIGHSKYFRFFFPAVYSRHLPALVSSVNALPIPILPFTTVQTWFYGTLGQRQMDHKIGSFTIANVVGISPFCGACYRPREHKRELHLDDKTLLQLHLLLSRGVFFSLGITIWICLRLSIFNQDKKRHKKSSCRGSRKLHQGSLSHRLLTGNSCLDINLKKFPVNPANTWTDVSPLFGSLPTPDTSLGIWLPARQHLGPKETSPCHWDWREETNTHIILHLTSCLPSSPDRGKDPRVKEYKVSCVVLFVALYFW